MYIGLFIIFVIFMIKLPSIVKNIAVEKLQTTIGRKVVSGDFRYNYIKNILSIEDLKVYEEDGKNIFVKFDSFDVNIDLLPLFTRKFYIKELILVNPNFTLEYKGEKANFNSILEKIATEKKAGKSGEETTSYIKRVELKDITVENFTFFYNGRKVQGKNKFTLKTPQMLYEDKNVLLNSTVDFYEHGRIDLNLEYKKEGILLGELETDKFLLDDKLYILKSLYSLETLEGEIDSDLNFTFDFNKKNYNFDGQLSMKDLRVSSIDFGELSSIGYLEGTIDSFQIKENKFLLGDIKTNKGVINVEDIKKYISFITKDTTSKNNITTKKKKESTYPIFNIKQVEISDYKIYDEKIAIEIGNFKINDLGTLEGNSKLEFQGKFQGSEVSLLGEMKKKRAIRKNKDLDYIYLGGDLSINSLDLKSIDPLLEETLYLEGIIDFSSRFDYLTDDLQMKNRITLKDLSLKKDKMIFKVKNINSDNTIKKDPKDYYIKGGIDVKEGTFDMGEINFQLKTGDIEIDELSSKKIMLKHLKLDKPWIKINKKEDKANPKKIVTQKEEVKRSKKDNLEKRIKVHISDISRDKAISSIELVVKENKKN